MRYATVRDLSLIELPRHSQPDGDLVVVEHGKALPYAALRAFTVRATAGAVRGRHAHKECSQFFLCPHGVIEVECDDGRSKRIFRLDSGHLGLLVPPSIWATETYVTDGSVLTVLCDRPYEPEDYLRDYGEFVAWRRAAEEAATANG